MIPPERGWHAAGTTFATHVEHVPCSLPKYKNFSTVCEVLALDSWNYCSGDQAQQPNIYKID